MSLVWKNGSIVNSSDQYIAHQTNCVSTFAGGLANTIFKQFPYSDIYALRSSGNKDFPGKIIISGNGEDERYILHMMGQYYPGKSKFNDSSYIDSPSKRKEYFKQCLEHIARLSNLTSISFPFKIGCGLAGGNWPEYLEMLEKFASKVNSVKVHIWKYE